MAHEEAAREAFFEMHEAEFNALLEDTRVDECDGFRCSYDFEPPEVEWAGEGSTILVCKDPTNNLTLSAIRLTTEVGIFTYLPEGIGSYDSRPCVGNHLFCEDEYDAGWYDCRWTFD